MSDKFPTDADSASSSRPAARPKAKPRYGDTDRPAARPSRPAVRPAQPGAQPDLAPFDLAPTDLAPAEKPAPVSTAVPTLPKAKAKPRHESKANAVKPPRTVPDWVKRPITIYTALVAAAAIFAGYALVVFLTSGDDESTTFAQARDTVLLNARQDIVVLNTLDYRTVDAGLRSWLDASTGNLHDQIANVSAADKKDIVTAKKKSDGKVIDAAVTELDNRAGSATVIATVETAVTPNDGTPPKRNRFSATMERVGHSWKLSDLQQVAVNLS